MSIYFKPYAVRMRSDDQKSGNWAMGSASCGRPISMPKREETYAANNYAELNRVKLIAISVRSRLFEGTIVEVRQSNQ